MSMQQDKLKDYRDYINKLTSTMNIIDNGEIDELNKSSEIIDISILKDIVDIEVENIYLIPKEHADFKTRRHAVLFFNYKKYLQLMEELGLDNSLKKDFYKDNALKDT